MQRVAIIGSGGAGKSTLARQLGERLGLPVYHLDALFWQPGWVATPLDEWQRIQQELAETEQWVIDGNYSATMEIRLARADTVIFLDMPRLVSLWGILRRWAQYAGKTRPDMGPGCPEGIDWEFVTWVWNFPKRSRPRVMEALSLHPHLHIIPLRSHRAVRAFLASLERPEEAAF